MSIIIRNFLNDLPLFVEIARQKSFSRAADVLDIGISTLSRRIRLLEKDMGVLLFYRDTRNVELTPTGTLLFERCEYILTETTEAYESVVLNMREPSGLIRICMFADTYNAHLKNALSGFIAAWPDIRMSVNFVEQSVDMRTDPYDVAFLIDPAIAPPLVARKLFTIEPQLYASPELFKRYPLPSSPDDLHALPCISLGRFGDQWTLDNGSRRVTVEIRPAFTFSAVDLCREFALAGHGVAMLRTVLVAPYEESGRLVRVLPDWSGPKHDLNLVTGPGQLPARVRLFLEYMQKHYRSLSFHP